MSSALLQLKYQSQACYNDTQTHEIPTPRAISIIVAVAIGCYTSYISGHGAAAVDDGDITIISLFFMPSNRHAPRKL